MKKLLPFVLALILCLCLLCASAEQDEYGGIPIGKPLADFSVQTITGETFTLSEALKEKGLVLINFWATWCGPCESEFPYLQEAYEQYKDRVEVLALSEDPDDTTEMLIQYANSHGLTFPVAREEGLGIASQFVKEGIPTTIIVDRFGNVAFLEVGSQSSASVFTRLFDYFLSEDYTETEILHAVPPLKPQYADPDPAELAAQANAEGSSLTYFNEDDDYVWPFVPADKDGRSALTNSNASYTETFAMLHVNVNAQAGEELAFDLSTDSLSAFNLLTVSVDGTDVKAYGGKNDWQTYVVPLTAGAHDVAFTYYANTAQSMTGEAIKSDSVWLDEVRLVSADEAAAIRAALPVYAADGVFALEVTNADALEIVFSDKDIIEQYIFGVTLDGCYILPSGSVSVKAHFTKDEDTARAFLLNYCDGVIMSMEELYDGNEYPFTGMIDSMETTGYAYGGVMLYKSIDALDVEDVHMALTFASEENVNSFVEEMSFYGIALSWTYADGSAPSTSATASIEDDGYAYYTVSVVDQYGDAVPGVIINFCTDTLCEQVTTDEDGVAVYCAEPDIYHVQVIKAPAGYEIDKTTEYYMSIQGDALALLAQRND
ncbi:MAG: redoxin domain-containing protein [Clostridia bacterium]|nr:redoxin domain-containing protein [Clostridia bacterium]